MSNELLEKVIVSTEIGDPAGSGLLSAEQSNRFIDYMWDATVLGSQVRTIRMRANDVEIDKIFVGERLLRKATEAVDTGENQGVTFAKISLTTTKLRLDWELSTETLEDNIEGEALEDHIARLMATQAGNDLEDLAINGDTAGGVTGLTAFDGWRKQALDGEATVVDAAGATLGRGLFNRALKAVPRKYMQRRNGLKFFAGTGLIQDYLFSLTSDENAAAAATLITNGPVTPEGPAGFTTTYAFGVPLQEVPYFDETLPYDADGAGAGAAVDSGELWLTFPQNLIWGVKREIQVYREFKPKKDTIEYTMYCRVGTGIENAEAFVVVRNVGLANS